MTKTLILTVGLPRSGKTTWARQQGIPIVNPDSIRLSLHGRRYEKLAESFVWAIAKIMVRSLFLAGHNKVIVDATHVTRKAREQWYKEGNWLVTYKVFNTSKEECLARARAEGDEEIIPIIERMATQYEPLHPDEEMSPTTPETIYGYNLDTGE